MTEETSTSIVSRTMHLSLYLCVSLCVILLLCPGSLRRYVFRPERVAEAAGIQTMFLAVLKDRKRLALEFMGLLAEASGRF